MSKINESIIDKLYTNKVNEAVSNEVKTGLKAFYNKASVESKSQKVCNDVLNALYLVFNSLGENIFDKPKSGYNKGEVLDNGDAETGPLIDYYPNEYYFEFYVRFKEEKSFKDIQSGIKDGLKRVKDISGVDYSMSEIAVDVDNDCAVLIQPLKGVLKVRVSRYTNDSLK